MQKHQIAALMIAQILPTLMICLGVKFLNKPVKRGCTIFWYKATFLYKDSKAWDYFHIYCGKRLLWIGIACLLLSAIASFFVFRVNPEAAVRVAETMMGVYFCLFIGALLWSDAELKQKFGKDRTAVK